MWRCLPFKKAQRLAPSQCNSATTELDQWSRNCILRADYSDLLLDACIEKHQDETMQAIYAVMQLSGGQWMSVLLPCHRYYNVITIALQGTQEKRFSSRTAWHDTECTELLAVRRTSTVPSAEKWPFWLVEKMKLVPDRMSSPLTKPVLARCLPAATTPASLLYNQTLAISWVLLEGSVPKHTTYGASITHA